MSNYIVIPASGTGTRFGGRIPKQFLRVNGREIIYYTIKKFESIEFIKGIVIATRPEYFSLLSEIISKYRFKKIISFVSGGETRMESVYNGLLALNCRKTDIVAVHDAVRPFVSKSLIVNLFKFCAKYGSVIPALPVPDTVKEIKMKNVVNRTISRENLMLAQTPQVFKYGEMMKSYKKAIKDGYMGTDESSILEFAEKKIRIIEGEKKNIKITTKEDIKNFNYYNR